MNQNNDDPALPRNPAFENVVDEVCLAFGVDRNELFHGFDRGRGAIARQVVYVLAADLTGMTNVQIAKASGALTRNVVTRARAKIRERLNLDAELNQRVLYVRSRILGSPNPALERWVEKADSAWRARPEDVLRAVARHLKIPVERLRRPISTYNDARARATAMYVLATVRNDKPVDIQRVVGGSRWRVSESIRDTKREMVADQVYGATVAEIIKELGGNARHQRLALGEVDTPRAVDENVTQILETLGQQVGSAVVRERRLRGLSVDRLAAYSSSSASSIQRLEDGRLCTISTIAKIAAAMDCEVVFELKPRLKTVHSARDLTPMERRLLRVYRTAKTRSKTAKVLEISEGTLEVHSSSIRAKLGAASLAEALTLAIARGVLHDAEPEPGSGEHTQS